MEVILYGIFAASILVSGIFGRLANEESTPRSNAVASSWLLEPEQLTNKGKRYRSIFLVNLLLLVPVFFCMLFLTE